VGVAHLSDLHVVGERYGFRIESGRSGPCGNERLARLLSRLEVIHATEPLDLILITGDITDAGRSSEWAEFLTAMAKHPNLAKKTLLLPGNHDVNVVDRANSARLDLPTSPGKRLRQLRALSAIVALQGDKVRVLDTRTGRLGSTLRDALAPHLADIAAFADQGTLRLSIGLAQVFDGAFPMVLPPDGDDRLGVILLNSNSEAHFSVTNAPGLIAVEQARAHAIAKRLPRARWIIALHHHLIEYPKPAKFISERIGTALINGTWFVRELQSLGNEGVVMHGHRHIDWIGECGPLRIISAPSPVMNGTGEPGHFHIHTLGLGGDGHLCLLRPQRVDIASTQRQAEGSASTWLNRPPFGKGSEEIGQPGH
jgi:predicted MPP superfamily phosphohydrolase